MDLQKIFDTLDHSILLEKLEQYSYRGPIHANIESYPSGRWQHVIKQEIVLTINRLILTEVSSFIS